MSRRDAILATLAAIPYAQMLGVRPEFEDGQFRLVLPYKASNIGNPALPALHGGALGGFLELCAITQLALSMERDGQPKPIGISVDYLRRGRPEDTFATARIARLGSRVANVRVEAWQSDPESPIATLHGNFLLPPKG